MPSKIQYGWGTELNFKNKGITALLIFGLNPEIFSSAFNSDENKKLHYNAHNIEVFSKSIYGKAKVSFFYPKLLEQTFQ